MKVVMDGDTVQEVSARSECGCEVVEDQSFYARLFPCGTHAVLITTDEEKVGKYADLQTLLDGFVEPEPTAAP